MERITTHRAAALIRAARRVLIAGHVRPDGDVIGSMAALALGLRQASIPADAWANTPVPPRYAFLEPAILVPPSQCPHSFDLCVLLDTPSFSRIDLDPSLVRGCASVLAIDHHPDSGDFATHGCVDTSAAATVILVHDILRALGATITKSIADALYTGLLTDTGCFTYSNTDRRAFALALALADAGADAAGVARMVFNTMTRQQVRLLADMLATLEFPCGGKAALMHISNAMFARTGTSEADIEEYVNHARAIDGVRVAALLTETSGGSHVRISLRSKTPDVPVNVLAGQYGGGGHACAAGATVDGGLDAVLPPFRRALESFAGSFHD